MVIIGNHMETYNIHGQHKLIDNKNHYCLIVIVLIGQGPVCLFWVDWMGGAWAGTQTGLAAQRHHRGRNPDFHTSQWGVLAL